MADKTFNSNLQPSTAFDTGRSPTTQSLTGQLTSSTRLPSSSSINSISSIISTSMEPKHHQFNMTSSLMSPPEPTPYGSFSHTSTPPKTIYAKPAGAFPLSPPVSPFTKTDAPEESAVSIVIKDPILYPAQDASSASSSQPPLFETDTLAAQRVVDGHVAARGSHMFRAASPPGRGEYELALEFKSRVAKAYNANRNLWFRRERQFLLEDRAIQSGLSVKRYHAIAPHPSRPRPSANAKAANNRVKTGGVVKASKPPRSTPVKHVRATTPGESKSARTDKDFTSIPDYCPPVSSLPNKPNSLKVDWRGAPIDLSDDPFYNKLHPDERLLAANLRLDCATYLTSKRRIFERRIECFKIGKEFRKTDAQQACKIDVNKASKLWQAFDKVGWLDASWIRQFV